MPIFVATTDTKLELQLLQQIAAKVPEVPSDADLVTAIKTCRQGVTAGQKILIVIDQFELWLHEHQDVDVTQCELAAALRQCDGAHVQSLLIVRDDFWMAANRFMDELDSPLQSDHNMSPTELLDRRHARTVLEAFGRAYGALPEISQQLTNEQSMFLDQVIEGLADGERIIPVRLAMFAEMVQGRPWIPSTLEQIGGTQGIGLTFLTESFSGPNARPDYRQHQTAVRAILEALLPAPGLQIRTKMCSSSELSRFCGYPPSSDELSEVIRILDADTRMITPIDPQDSEQAERSGKPGKYYQLTHDSLVPAIREWNAAENAKTRQGRTRLRFDNQAALWKANPTNRYLPSLWEFVNYQWYIRPQSLNSQQQMMMSRARAYHSRRVAIVTFVVSLAVIGSIWMWKQNERARVSQFANSMVVRLCDASLNNVPGILPDVLKYRDRTYPQLQAIFSDKSRPTHQRLNAAIALADEDPEYRNFVLQEFLRAPSESLPVLNTALEIQDTDIQEQLWSVIQDEQNGDSVLRAASLLADQQPDNEQWEKAGQPIAHALLADDPKNLGYWMKSLQPISQHLGSHLLTSFVDSKSELSKSLAFSMLRQFGLSDPDELVALLAHARADQFDHVVEMAKQANAENSIYAHLARIANKSTVSARDKAAIIVASAKLQSLSQVMPLIRDTLDPTERATFIGALSDLKFDRSKVFQQIKIEPNAGRRRDLLLAWGSFRNHGANPDEEATIVQLVSSDPDPGVHAAAAWCAARSKIDVTNALLDRARGVAIDNHRWYLTKNGRMTFSIVDMTRFEMGSPNTEPYREDGEQIRERVFNRTVAVSLTETTWRHVAEFLDEQADTLRSSSQLLAKSKTEDADLPCSFSWFDAAAFCNWLSAAEGIPQDEWCYQTNDNGEYATGMKPFDDFVKRTGYRLPTEPEWEYLCRAGTTMIRSFGHDVRLVPYYAQCRENSTGPQRVAQLRPNQFGLFDVLGNVHEWCNNAEDHSTLQGEPEADTRNVSDTPRALRGNAYNLPGEYMRSANRSGSLLPNTRESVVGFRIVRTIK